MNLQEHIRKTLREEMGNKINESVDKSEEKKLKLVTRMIHEFFDEVSFIDIKKYENKPMIRVYFDNDEYAGNEETYFAEQIQRKIYEYTGIKLRPYWHHEQYNTDSDFRLDAIKLKYDNEGNVINESEEKQPKYLNIIKELIEPFKKEDCVCDIRVTFEHDMYMIYLVFGQEELNDLFFSFVGRADYGRNLRNDVKNAIKGYLPIDNLYIGSISKPNCEWKPMNESAFFRRRVDMSLMDKEFFENLNYITSIFLKRYNEGKRFDIFQFENKMLNYLIDGYHNELTDGGLNDFPYDEVYKFLSNHFHNKIKDRYDTFFGNKINESEIKEGKYISVLKDLTEQFKDEDCLCDIEVKYVGGEDDLYFVELILSNRDLDNKFNGSSFRIREYTQKLKRKVNDGIYEYLPISFLVKFKDTPNCRGYNKLNESENKKQSLIELIDEYGLYDFINMSGLDIRQISSELKNMNNPKEVLKQYIRDFVLTHGNKWGDNSGILSGYEIQLSNNKYVDDIMVQDSDQIAVEILEFDIDEYGHTEQNDQYITTINNLTNEELLSIISWMMETIKNGDWD